MTDLHVRWMIRRDMTEVLAIEARTAELTADTAWSEDDFLNALRQRNVIGMVVERGENVVGFMVYELHKDHLLVVNLKGIGHASVKALKDKIVSKLSAHRRTRALYLMAEAA